MKRNIFTLMLALMAVATVTAATFTGKVVDETGLPAPFANVVLLNAADSAFVSGTTTREDGTFNITGNVAKPLLKFSYLGYKTRIMDAVTTDLGVIALEPETMMLGEVVIKGQRPEFKITAEGLKTNVENTLLSKVGTAKAVLENLPGVQRKNDGLEVFGKGTPIIYINGRKLQNQTELDQISSEDIQSVQLITNPGAKYDASVGAVILIKTKRQQGEGFSANTQASYYASECPDLALGVNWNYRHKGLDVFGSAWYNDDRYMQNDDVILAVKADTIWHMDQLLNVKTHHNSLYTSLGMNYIFNDDHAAGFRYDTKAHFLERGRGTFTADVTTNGQFYDHLENSLYESSKYNMPHTLNAYYSGKVGGTSIDFNTDYVFSKNRERQYNDEVSQEQQSRTVTSQSVVRNQLCATKLVLSWDLWGGNLQVGTEFDHTRRHDDYINPEQIVPTSFTEQKENNYILFTEYARPLPFGQIMVGLRNENVTTNYYNQGVRIAEQSRNYHHLFPSVGLMAAAGQVQLMANYAVKIKRPYYHELSNSVTYANRFTWQSGNPLLKPSIRHDASLMAMYRWVTLILEYKHTDDIIVNVGKEVPGNESVTWLYRENVDNEDAIQLVMVLSPRFGLYEPSLTMAMLKEWMKIPSPAGFIRPERPIYLVQFNNNFQLASTLTASADFTLTTKGDQENVSLTKATCVLDLGVTKTFLNDRLSVRVKGHNLLNSQQHVKLNYGDHTLWQNNRNDSRRVELTVRYKFNSTKSKYRGTGAGSDEKERL